jgi:hypothetical protein
MLLEGDHRKPQRSQRKAKTLDTSIAAARQTHRLHQSICGGETHTQRHTSARCAAPLPTHASHALFNKTFGFASQRMPSTGFAVEASSQRKGQIPLQANLLKM